MDKLRRTVAAMHGMAVQVGVFGDDSARKDEGNGISNVRLAAVHEFGATIDHPGGTPYIWGSDGALFLNKSKLGSSARSKFNIPVTKAHKIKIPERSFIRGAFDQYRALIAAASDGFNLAVLDGKMTPRSAMERLGLIIQGLIQKRMSRGIGPALARSTVKRKQMMSAVGRRMRKKSMAGPANVKPLIDTGQLRNSVTYRVTKRVYTSGGR
jgi:hypothetical protein